MHGILFRIIGEAFAALPTVETVIASGFSQRINSATGDARDDYLLSVRAERSKREAIDFSRLRGIDAVEALARHELVRRVQRSAKLQSITPLLP